MKINKIKINNFGNLSDKKIDAEENVDTTVKFGVKKAPTLIVPTDEGNKVYENASNIKGYIESVH